MIIQGKRFEKTKYGTLYVGADAVDFQLDSVSRWGLYECYGIKGSTLVAELDGQPVAVIVSKQTGEAKKAAAKIRKGIRVDGSALSYIRKTLKSAGIVWESERVGQ